MGKSGMRLALVLVASVPVMACAAGADDVPAKTAGGEIMLGAGRGPLYAGSSESVNFPVLGLKAYLNSSVGRFALDMGTLSWTPLRTESYSASLLLARDGGRKEDGGGFLRPKSKEHHLLGMGDLEPTWETGVAATYRAGPLNLGMKVLRAIGDKGHRGTHGEFSLGHLWQLNDRWALNGSTSLGWGDNRYMDAYFGVSPEQSARSRFRAYDPKGGFHEAKVSTLLAYQWTHEISIGALVSYARLLVKAADSPIAERSGNWTALTGIRYAF